MIIVPSFRTLACLRDQELALERASRVANRVAGSTIGAGWRFRKRRKEANGNSRIMTLKTGNEGGNSKAMIIEDTMKMGSRRVGESGLRVSAQSWDSVEERLGGGGGGGGEGGGVRRVRDELANIFCFVREVEDF